MPLALWHARAVRWQSGTGEKKPPKGGLILRSSGRRRVLRASRKPANSQALGASSCCNSPDSYISIMMSEPPMNSPCT